MTATSTLSTLFVLSILATSGCASNAPPTASAPEPTPAAAAPSASTAPPPVAPAPAPEPTADTTTAAPAEPKAEPAETPAPPSKPPSELLLAEGVAFVLDWQNSTAKLVATEKCEKRVGDDTAAVAQCVESERGKFAADVLRFRKIGGQLRWTIYKRNGSQLQVVYSVPILFADETDYSVSLQLQGKGNGYPPIMSQERTVPITFPSEYSIELNDPIWGTLIYSSKRGIVND